MNLENLHVDTLVIGGGIAGMQAALDLADQGVKVALVEREPSIGGKMITLSKVFPTLDCCSCITTPKMSAVAHHPNIQLFTYCDLQSVEETGSVFRAAVVQKPRYWMSANAPAAAIASMPARLPTPAPSTAAWGPTAPSTSPSPPPSRRRPSWISRTASCAASARRNAPSRPSTFPSSPNPSRSKPPPSSPLPGSN